MSSRRLLLAIAALVAATSGLPAPSAASSPSGLGLAQLPGTEFPDRSFALTLPDRQRLSANKVYAAENGEPVRDLRVRPGTGSGSTVVLAIDASESMHSGVMDEAMAAARRFLERRRPDQKVGIVFFSRTPRVALAPTADAARIDAVASETPALSKGTRIFDATKASLDMLTESGERGGTIVVVSDGADVGSVMGVAQLKEELDEAGVRVFTVGLRSPSFDSTALEQVAHGGTYSEASSSRRLSRVFAMLGERLGNEYVLSYRSDAPLDSRVAVTVEVDGVRGLAAAAYETPSLDLEIGDPRRASNSAWVRPLTVVALALLVGSLLGGGLLALVYPRREGVLSRVESYSEPLTVAETERTRGEDRKSPLDATDRMLSRGRWWQAIKLDLELTRVQIPAVRLLVATAATTMAIAWLVGVVLQRPVLMVLVLLVPIGLRMLLGMRAGKVRRAFAEQLPDNLQVLASALRAGHSFVGALSAMAEDAAEPSRTEFRRVMGDDQLGVSVEDSLAVVGDRMENDEVAYIGLIATIQRESGGNTAEVLDRVTGTIRERAQLRRLVRTLTAQGRLGGWIVTLLPLGMIAFLTTLRPDYLDPMLESTTGVIAMAVGAGMLAIGAFVIRRVVDIEI